MRNSELCDLVLSGKKPLVRMVSELDCEESCLDNGMIVKITGVEIDDVSDGGTVIIFNFDEKQYREQNYKFMKRNYYDTSGQPTLNYIEANMIDGKVFLMDYQETFELVAEDDITHLSKSYRFESNPDEKAFHDAFVEHTNNDYNKVSQIVFPSIDGRKPVSYLNDREKQIVINTIQWLGSPVGQNFLHHMGYVKDKQNV